MHLTREGLEQLAQLLTEEDQERFIKILELTQRAADRGAGVALRMQVDLTISFGSEEFLGEIEEEMRALGSTIRENFGESSKISISFPRS